MRFRQLSVTILLPALLGAAPVTPVAQRPGIPTALTCSSPVKPTDTAASLLDRFGSNARIESYEDEYGEIERGVVLWPGYPAQRLEVEFWDNQPGEGLTQVSRVMATGSSRWRVMGLGIGDDWQSISRVNGRGFQFDGFGYSSSGGTVSLLNGGKLSALPGGCRTIIWLATASGAKASGRLAEAARIGSDEPALRGARLTIHGIGIGLPLPRD